MDKLTRIEGYLQKKTTDSNFLQLTFGTPVNVVVCNAQLFCPKIGSFRHQGAQGSLESHLHPLILGPPLPSDGNAACE